MSVAGDTEYFSLNKHFRTLQTEGRKFAGIVQGLSDEVGHALLGVDHPPQHREQLHELVVVAVAEPAVDEDAVLQLCGNSIEKGLCRL